MKNPFQREAVSYKSEQPQTPYQRAQQEWDDRIGSSRAQAQNWRLIAILSLLIAIFMLLAMILVLTVKKDHLFIAEVTKTGRVVNVAPLTVAYNPTLAQKEYFITQFIELTRNIPLDPVVAKQNWLSSYKFLTQRGAEILNNYWRENNPVDMLGKKTVTVKITDINPVSDATFQVDWNETIVNNDGKEEGQKNYSGLFTIILHVPDTQEEILSNPLGIYIVDFHISPREKAGV